MKREYLGEGVTVELDDLSRIVLTSGSNTIVLEPEVVAGLELYIEKLVQELYAKRREQ